MKQAIGLATMILFALAPEASAQEADVGAGAAYAEQVCAACHAVLANEQISPLAEGPTFRRWPTRQA